MTGSHCDKIGDFSFSLFGFIVLTDRQTKSQAESQTRIIAILTRLPSAQVTLSEWVSGRFGGSLCWEDLTFE